jgi:hypothetical protein
MPKGQTGKAGTLSKTAKNENKAIPYYRGRFHQMPPVAAAESDKCPV